MHQPRVAGERWVPIPACHAQHASPCVTWTCLPLLPHNDTRLPVEAQISAEEALEVHRVSSSKYFNGWQQSGATVAAASSSMSLLNSVL